ncbi:MAG: hypothetical protein OXF74_08905 [Rhodobacteraceae bacterium]|nr:hypothetical protein [Paracoccaceae bacterium]
MADMAAHGHGERGATLIEAAFAITLFGSLMLLANSIISQEIERQRDRSIGRDLGLMTELGTNYVQSEYEQLRRGLAGLSSVHAITGISIREMADAGYIPHSMLRGGERENAAGQRYSLLLRGVSRLDTDSPPATLEITDLDSDSDGLVDEHLLDGMPGNDELDLEVLLVTSGGEELPPQRGNPAAVAAEMPTSGFVQTRGTASGPFGSWSMDITPFSALSLYPDKGRFVSLLALSGFGVTDFSNAGTVPPQGNPGNPFERCPGLSGAALADCAGNNEVYTDIRFRAVDQDNDGVTESLWGIENPIAIRMSDPADTDGDGTDDRFPELTGLLRLACGGAGTGRVTSGTLLIDCTAVSLNGALTVSGMSEFTGGIETDSDIQAAGSVTASRFFAGILGGQDLTKGIYSASIITMDSDRIVTKPDCRDSGSDAMVLVAPVGFSSPDGSALVGLKAFAEEHSGGTEWVVRMQAAIDRDSDNDGVADVVELNSGSDFTLALTRCS